jgi:hypothetical protein
MVAQFVQFQLQFSTTPLAASGLIRVATKSKFSHVDVVVPRGLDPALDVFLPADASYGLLGASDPGGVMLRQPLYHQFLRRHRMTLVTDLADEFFQVMKGEIGKPFDNTALLRALDPNWRGADWKDNGSWFCAELVAWALLRIGFWKHRKWDVEINLYNVTPEDILKYLAGDYDPVEFDRELGVQP